jgi:hypothetical protein
MINLHKKSPFAICVGRWIEEVQDYFMGLDPGARRANRSSSLLLQLSLSATIRKITLTDERLNSRSIWASIIKVAL